MPATLAKLPEVPAEADEDLGPLPPVVPWTPAAYHAAYEAGAFGDTKVELLEGKVYEKMAMNDPHIVALRKARRQVDSAFAGVPHITDGQTPLRLGDSEPEPDLFVLRGDDLGRVSSDPADVLLVVEISDTTYALDRSVKLRRYARAGYREYWIVNLVRGRLEVYRQPRAEDGIWTYGEFFALAPGESVEPLAVPGRAVAVDDLLP